MQVLAQRKGAVDCLTNFDLDYHSHGLVGVDCPGKYCPRPIVAIGPQLEQGWGGRAGCCRM